MIIETLCGLALCGAALALVGWVVVKKMVGAALTYDDWDDGVPPPPTGGRGDAA